MVNKIFKKIKMEISFLWNKYFNTIFKKLVSIFIIILIINLSLSSVILYYFLGNFAVSESEKNLDSYSNNMVNYFGRLYKELSTNYDNIYNTESNIVEIMDFISLNTSSMIWLVGVDGEILSYDNQMTSYYSNTFNKLLDLDTKKYKLNNKQQYSKIMSGTVSKEKYTGDFYGLFSDTGVSWLVLQKSIIVKDLSGDKLVGAVYFCTPLSSVNKAQTDIFKLFIMAALLSAIIAVLLVNLFSLKITKPIKEINNIAKIISKGEFKERITSNSNDEVGQLAQSFNNMVVALENLEEMRKGFIANVSHELRTPMTSIQGFVEGILDGTITNEKQSFYLKIVSDETRRLTRLINDLLDLAKMEAGEMKINLRPANINEIIRRCIIKLESQFMKKSLNVEANFEDEELWVSIDIDSIERVLINLLHNAIKFTDENGKIEIETISSKNKVFVKIKDNGIGINEEELKYVFDRFYKIDKSRGKDKTGTGLGLAIVKNILKEHKQEISVESKIKEGTQFTFSLEKINFEQS